MLPPELVELITNQLDIQSVCALSQSSEAWSSVISDSVFENQLQKVCPWFEPQFSHRITWKECAIEYCRRLHRGAKFARPMRKVDAKEFEEPLTFDTMPEGVDRAKLRESGNVYTSRHGINLDLSAYGHLAADSVEISNVASFDHVLVLAVHLESAECHVLVKYKDSESVRPDIKRSFRSGTDVYCHILGRHVFVSFSAESFMQDDSEIMYVNTGDIVAMIGQNAPMGFTFFDGLLLFFNGKYYTSVGGDFRVDTSGTQKGMMMFDDFTFGYKFTYPDYEVSTNGSRFYFVESDAGKLYTVDDARGIMADTVEVDDYRYQVISDAQRRALDEANDLSKQEEILAMVR